MNDRHSNRQNGERSEGEFELTAAEEKALAELPRDRRPSDPLEERVVTTLNKRGLLAKPRRRVIEFTVWRCIAAAAACLVLLATGFVLGQWTGSLKTPGIDPFRQVSEDSSLAASLQQTGSAYLLALQRLANAPGDNNSDEAIQGQEVALTTLCTAADKVTRLVPKDVLTEYLLAALDTDTDARESGGSGEITIEHGQIVEF